MQHRTGLEAVTAAPIAPSHRRQLHAAAGGLNTVLALLRGHVAAAAATGVGVLRILAGEHHVTDVVAGWALGTLLDRSPPARRLFTR